jgi:uncharacterized RDD family membrane protein YckC
MADDTKACPTLEQLAAFAEGRLSGAERDRVIAHLTGCDDCREVLAETMETTAELRAEEAPASVVELHRAPAPSRGRLRLATALAATVVVLVGAAWVVVEQGRPVRSPPSPEAWLAELPPAPELVPWLWSGTVMRGAPEGGDQPSRQSAELGALLVDLRVAARAGELASASERLRRAAAILDEAGAMDDDVATFRRIAGVADSATMRQEINRALPAIEERIRERFGPFYLDLGAFAEEVRLAGTSGRRGLLDAPRTTRYVEWVLSQQDEVLSPSVTQGLRRLQQPDATPAEQVDIGTSMLRVLTY